MTVALAKMFLIQISNSRANLLLEFEVAGLRPESFEARN